MDFLLEPNIAYLIILAGVMLSMMALVTPGTGLFETAALLLLVLAGYAAYNMAFNWWALALLALSILPFLYAIQKPKREAWLILSILLLVSGSVFMFAAEGELFAVNPLLAAVASSLVAGFLWIAVRKAMLAAQAPPLHDMDRLIGQVGEARTRVHEDGSVQVAGELWSARSEEPIPAGAQVRVLRREGFVLVVEKDKPAKS
jgi:membrane-bound serine protease (ClpP class)